MALIPLVPYSKISDQMFGEAEIEITKPLFSSVAFQPGKSAIVFSGCLFKKITIINNDDIPFEYIDIAFTDCFIENIEVEIITSKNIRVSFAQTIIANGVLRNKKLLSVNVTNSITDGLFIDGIDSVHISYSESNIFPIRWRKLLRKLGNKNNFNAILARKNSYYLEDIKRIIIIGDENKDQEPGLFTSGIGESKEMRYRYRLTKEEKLRLNINIDLKYPSSHIGKETKIKKIHLNSLSMKGEPSGKVAIEECTINRLFLHELKPKGQLEFYYINSIKKGDQALLLGINDIETKVEIKQCNIDGSTFDNFDFDTYSTISLFRTQFSKAVFYACNFPTDYKKFNSLENIHYPDKLKDNYHKDMYEIFLQLRKALENTGNFQESLKLHAVSNDALNEIQNLTWWDKRILCINKISNNHGISVKRAFVGFLISSILVYIFYLWSIDRIFTHTKFDTSLIGYYFAFIDLTHRNDFLVVKDDFGDFTLALDFLGKMVVGFYIYQFIAAFRKYGRK